VAIDYGIDRMNLRQRSNPKARDAVLDLMSEFSLQDVWPMHHSSEKRDLRGGTPF